MRVAGAARNGCKVSASVIERPPGVIQGDPPSKEVSLVKNVGILAIVAGIVVIVLGLLGVLGQGGNSRTVMVGAVILLAVGYLLFKKGRRRGAA
jgi:hypothetical protein